MGYLDKNPDARRNYAHTLKVLYDEDWTEEKDILSYYDDEEGSAHPGFEAAKQAATPFLKWLKTADSDDDEAKVDGDDDDDDEEGAEEKKDKKEKKEKKDKKDKKEKKDKKDKKEKKEKKK